MAELWHIGEAARYRPFLVDMLLSTSYNSLEMFKPRTWIILILGAIVVVVIAVWLGKSWGFLPVKNTTDAWIGSGWIVMCLAMAAGIGFAGYWSENN